jgi:hypothetical protein
VDAIVDDIYMLAENIQEGVDMEQVFIGKQKDLRPSCGYISMANMIAAVIICRNQWS